MRVDVPSPESRDTAGVTSRLMLSYAELRGGRLAVERMLAHAGCSHREKELRDEATWFSLETKIRLFKGLVAALEDPAAVRKAGEQALELGVADGLKIALRALGSPALVFRNVVRANAKFSAIHSLELVELGRGRATVSFGDNAGGAVHPLDCDYTRGLLSVVPALFGLARAQIVHHDCAARGAARCVYHVSWTQSRVVPRTVIGTAAVSAAALAGAGFAAPVLLPLAGAAAVTAGGVLAARAAGDLRARSRHLEQEVQWRDDVAVRLTESMQDLVSALDVDEVLDKVVGNARATVNSKEFALLVAEDGLLRCRASTGVPEDSLATLETWVADEHPRATEPVLVEDVAMVPALTSLSGHRAMPVGSVCLAPLTFRGSTVGHLLALAPQARTFLPRDLDLVTSYAAASAIALANARHFAEQRALATRDPLTGLLNHREFHESVERELQRGRRHGGAVAVALFDLDGFKLVNDSDGHAEGDRVLRAVAGALRDACRASDLAFRVGGDEFALLLPETEGDEARVVANRVRRALAQVDPRVSASIGTASWPGDGGSKDVLLANADAALYAMKGAARQRRTAVPSAHRADDAGTPLLRERLAMANRLSAKLAPVLGPRSIAEVAVEELHRSFDELVAYVQRREGERLQVLAVGGTVTERCDVPLWSQGVHQGVSGRVARTGRPALVHDTVLDPDHIGAELVDPERAHAVTLRSQLAVPLRVDGRLWGVLSIQAAEPGAYTSDDVLLLETVAAQVAAALHRAELVAELSRSRAR